MARIELVTSSLPRKRSTPELHWRSWSGRRGSNPRPSAWKADALPTELLPQFPSKSWFFRLRLGNANEFPLLSTCAKTPLFKVKARSVCVGLLVGEDGFEPPKVKTSRFTVCPIWPLWYSPKIPKNFGADGGKRTHDPEITNHVLWPTELHRQCCFVFRLRLYFLNGIAKVGIIFKSPKLFNLFLRFFVINQLKFTTDSL